MGVGFLALAFVSGVILAAMAHRAQLRRVRYIQTRKIAIMSEARQGRFPVVVLGDSLVERADIATLCGARVLNAGIAGARVGDLLAFAPQLFAAAHPQLVIVAVGVNDAHVWGRTDPATFGRDYARLIQMAKTAAATVKVSDIAPVGAPHFARALLFDSAHIERLNRTLPALGVPVIELSNAMAKAGKPLPDAYTNDGVHLTAAGYVQWRNVFATACKLDAAAGGDRPEAPPQTPPR